MAEVTLADIIEPSVFSDYVVEKTTEKSALYESGVLTTHPEITKIVMSGASTIDMPFWEDLADNEANISSDNSASNSTPDSIGSGQDAAIQHFLNKSWSAMDLTANLTGKGANTDPMRVMADLVADYWVRQMQRKVIGSLNGVIADNVANDSGDMVVDIATDDLAAVTAAELISGDAVIDAMQTLGDAKDSLSIICMHSVVHSRLQKQNLISTVHNSEGKVLFTEYMGKRVLVDDTMPAVAGINRITYTTFLLGAGSLAYAEGMPKVPHETDRLPAAGDGGGQEVLYSRKNFVLHPRGIKFTKTSMAGKSPTNAELATAANWDRVLDRKKIRIVALKTNG